jgi:uncharacterized surface protein with fasciclin (FAS1) repeats
MRATNRFTAPALLALALLFTASTVAAGHHRAPPTMLERLAATDGAQALVAAVLVVDGAKVLDFSLAELLDDRHAEIILFAPGNRAFENLLGLDPGFLDGLTAAEIAEALPGIIGGLGLDADAVAAVLLKHASLPRRANRGTASENALLRRGEVEVADGSVLPVGIGDNGVSINREADIVKANVFVRNGVIHFVDAVIVDDLLSE